ncbi:hypothetical protein [Cellulomonas sp. Leaf334]|uniref:hypothetical protein n=1 Tax=Cellulomonas sp. Leaf334 TaxID=1736339 RepID=UPI0006FE9867|nr:hypothetical protein [Cellulomonas sp. Leaf334]KQR11791.1 hypothetical protein ASF78_11235 [Cellulomonas sp. Leaf334]
MIQLVRELTASGPEDRGLAADGVTDLVGALDAGQAHAVAQLLVWLAVDEEDAAALESQLNALAELASHDLLPAAVAAEVRAVPHSRLHGSSLEHYEYLLSVADLPDSEAP